MEKYLVEVNRGRGFREKGTLIELIKTNGKYTVKVLLEGGSISEYFSLKNVRLS